MEEPHLPDSCYVLQMNNSEVFRWPGHTFPASPKSAFSLLGVFPLPILIILFLHLTLNLCNHYFTNMLLVYISFIISFTMSLVRAWLHLLYSAREYQENKDGLVQKAAECWRSKLCPCLCLIIPLGCCVCHLNFSKMVTKFVFLISWLYRNGEGTFAEVLGYIGN